MGHYQELPKLVHPDFAVPNRKPVGAVEIDTGSWLYSPPHNPNSLRGANHTPRLYSAFIFGAQGIVDLAGAFKVSSLNSDEGGTSAALKVGSGGTYVDCSNTGACVNFGSTYSLGGANSAYTISSLVDFPLPQSLAFIVGDDFFGFNGTKLYLNAYIGTVAYITFDPATLSAGPHRITVSFYHTPSSEEARFFVDGSFVGSSTSIFLPSTELIAGIGNANITLSRDRGARLYDFFLWEGVAMSDSAVARFAKNPYQLLKPSNPITYFIPSAGGGAQEAAFISALSQSAVFTVVSIKGADMAQPVNLDTQFAGDAASNAAVSAGLQSGYSAGSEISIETDLSFALQPAMSVTANAAASSDILAAIQAGVLFAAIAQTEATITLASAVGSVMTAQVSAGGDVEASIGVNAVAGAQLSAEAQTSADLTATSNVGAQVDAQSSVESNIAGGSVVDAQATADVSHEATVSFALQLSTTKTAEAIANASITLDASLATTILAQAAAEAGIAVGQVVNVVFDATTIAGDIITPDGRTYRISAESRIFVVPYENRTFTIH